MFKAIWWGLGGLLLGLPLGELWGAAAGGVAGTLIGAVLGAWPSIRDRCGPRPCRGCAVMCERKSGVPLGGAVKAAGLAVAAVAGIAVLHAVLPFLLPLAAVTVALAVACVPVLRKARRLCVPRGSKFHARYQQITRPPARVKVRAALPAPRKAIEAAPLRGLLTLRPSDYRVLDEKRRDGWERMTS